VVGARPAVKPRGRPAREIVRAVRAGTALRVLGDAVRRKAGVAEVPLSEDELREVSRTVPLDIRTGDDVAVLVHGSLATGGAWRPLRRKLEAKKAFVVTFTYGPRAGVRDWRVDLSAREVALLDRLIGDTLDAFGYERSLIVHLLRVPITWRNTSAVRSGGAPPGLAGRPKLR